MIHPLRNFKIKGVVWYQGEGNAGQADKYRQLFSTLIGEWRDVFGYEFPYFPRVPTGISPRFLCASGIVVGLGNTQKTQDVPLKCRELGGEADR